MNDKSNFPRVDESLSDMSREEFALYKSVLEASLPEPKTDIHAAVTAKIKAERKRMDIMRKAAKWGSLAACLILVSLVGIKLLPELKTKSSDTLVMSKDYKAYDAITYTSNMSGIDENEDAALPEEENEDNADAKKTLLYKMNGFAENSSENDSSGEWDSAENETGTDNANVLYSSDGSENTSDGTNGTNASNDTDSSSDKNNSANTESFAESSQHTPPFKNSADGYRQVNDQLYSNNAPFKNYESNNYINSAGNNLCGSINNSSGDSQGDDELRSRRETFIPALAGAEVDTKMNGSADAGASYPLSDCSHSAVFGNSYHDIPTKLISEVGDDAFGEWIASANEPEELNIVSFVEHFGITKEKFVSLYRSNDFWYYKDYDIDLIFSDNGAGYFYYCISGGNYAKMVYRNFEYELKLKLVSEVGVENYSKWAALNGYPTLISWDIPAFVRDNSIPETKLRELYEINKADFAEKYPSYNIPSYNTFSPFSVFLSPKVTEK